MRLLQNLLLVTCVSVLGGCITETSGGLPGPAAAEDRVSAHLDVARGYLDQRDWTRAKKPLERALAIDSRNVEAHVLSGVLYAAEGEDELAESHYRRALQYAPRNAQALNNFAAFLYRQRRYEEALQPLSELVKDTSYRARPLVFESLGLTHLQLGDKEAARGAFTRALQLNNRLPRSNLEMAELALADGNVALAQTQFDFYNRLARPTARSTCLGLRLSVRQNDADNVARYQLALKNLFPEAADQCQIRD